MPYIDRKAINKAVLAVTGKRFCTSCRTMQLPENGKQLHKYRWACAHCLKRREERKA
jgi:hypothetical protein